MLLAQINVWCNLPIICMMQPAQIDARYFIAHLKKLDIESQSFTNGTCGERLSDIFTIHLTAPKKNFKISKYETFSALFLCFWFVRVQFMVCCVVVSWSLVFLNVRCIL